MSWKCIIIRFEDPEYWGENRENVDEILEEFTGTSDHPSTNSFPPIIFGVNLVEDGIKRLRDLAGVIVEDDDD